jgi:hypothetical protein
MWVNTVWVTARGESNIRGGGDSKYLRKKNGKSTSEKYTTNQFKVGSDQKDARDGVCRPT